LWTTVPAIEPTNCLEEIAAVDSRVLVVSCAETLGNSALAAGFDHASGEFILAMDGDRATRPKRYSRLSGKAGRGIRRGSGWRRTGSTTLMMRRIPSAARFG